MDRGDWYSAREALLAFSVSIYFDWWSPVPTLVAVLGAVLYAQGCAGRSVCGSELL